MKGHTEACRKRIEDDLDQDADGRIYKEKNEERIAGQKDRKLAEAKADDENARPPMEEEAADTEEEGYFPFYEIEVNEDDLPVEGEE